MRLSSPLHKGLTVKENTPIFFNKLIQAVKRRLDKAHFKKKMNLNTLQ